MPSEEPSKLRSLARTVRGAEPPPPIGAYEEPPSVSDRRQMFAFFFFIALIGTIAFSVVYFDLFNLRSHDATPTATARPAVTVTAAP